MLKKTILAALGAAALTITAGAAHAEYPEKPIKLIVPYGAGGGTDSLARLIQATIEKYDLMPQPLVIVNATGAGGVVGARRVKNAEPDGYTFLQMHNELFALASTDRLGFDPLEAFEPVAQTTQSCLYLAVPGDSEIQSFEDMVAYAEEHPGDLKLADIIGGISHFAAVTMMDELGIDFGVVQTGGTSERFASLKGGHTDMAFMSSGWIERGGDELQGLVWMGETAPEGSELPTAEEVGLNAVGCLNRRFWAPAGTPQEHIDYFQDVLTKVMETPELKEYHEKQMSDIRVRTGEELVSDIKAEMKLFESAADSVMTSMQ